MKIKVACREEKNGMMEIDADVYGSFAVHRRIKLIDTKKRGEWVVTHIPTGSKVTSGRKFKLKTGAIGYAKALAKINGTQCGTFAENDIDEPVAIEMKKIFDSLDESLFVED